VRSQHPFVFGAEGGEQARGALDVGEDEGDSPPMQLSHRPPVSLSSPGLRAAYTLPDVSASRHLIVAYPTAPSEQKSQNDSY